MPCLSLYRLNRDCLDVVIIDEASQCDIASCFPAMFRAKKAIIVGDDKQLPHLSFLEKAKEQSFMSQYNIPDKYQLMWRFRTNSIFDVANYYSSTPVLLDEHFRSYPPIINFSNQEFYGNRIKVMNKELEVPECLDLHIVKNAKVDLDSTKNMAEAEEILKKVQEIVVEEAKNNPEKPSSIGIISPFRAQVDLIKKALDQVLDTETIMKHEISVGTAHTFQGDERDIMILSLTIAPNSHFQSLIFAQKPNLFNVAITRARKKLICFVSKKPENIERGLLRRFLEYIQAYKKEVKAQEIASNNEYNNKQEAEIATYFEKEGYKVISNFKSAGFNINLVISKDETTVAVELDGVTKPEGNEITKQATLERCGWKVIRITAREFHYSKKACINRIQELFNA